jgi:hypothetical protein
MLEQIKREIAEDPYYRNNFDNDGQKFIAWYLRRVLLRDDAATRDDITDGADDKQIDAVIVDDPEQRIVVIQGKFITTGQVDGGPLKEVLGAWVRLQDLPALQRDSNERLKRKIEAIRLALDEDYRVEFELLTTGTLTTAADADLKAFADKMAESEDFSASLHLIDTEVLQARLAEAEARALPGLEHTITLDPSKTLIADFPGGADRCFSLAACGMPQDARHNRRPSIRKERAAVPRQHQGQPRLEQEHSQRARARFLLLP